MNSIIDILPKLESKVQQKFLSILFSTIIVMCGKVNFRNLSRYSEISERTYRRQFSRSHNFIKGNAEIIKIAILPTSRQIIATDCSFIKKSGKATYGIEYFYNGSAGKAEKGLEISVIAVVDVDRKQGYPLSVQQTPPAQPESAKTRIDWYLEQLGATKPYLPKSAQHVVSDGFYSKIKWVDGVTALGLDAIGKLRCDADLRYVYTGEQKPRGRKRKYDSSHDALVELRNSNGTVLSSTGLSFPSGSIHPSTQSAPSRTVTLAGGSNYYLRVISTSIWGTAYNLVTTRPGISAGG